MDNIIMHVSFIDTTKGLVDTIDQIFSEGERHLQNEEKGLLHAVWFQLDTSDDDAAQTLAHELIKESGNPDRPIYLDMITFDKNVIGDWILTSVCMPKPTYLGEIVR